MTPAEQTRLRALVKQLRNRLTEHELYCGFNRPTCDCKDMMLLREVRTELDALLTEARAERGDLHQRIMNIPAAKAKGWESVDWQQGYASGHRDARQAAAELVAETEAKE